jgi:hypothetical protein
LGPHCPIRDVRRIVLADAQHRSRPGNGRPNARAVFRLEYGQLAGVEGRAGARDAVVGEERAVDVTGQSVDAVVGVVLANNGQLTADLAKSHEFHGAPFYILGLIWWVSM